MKITVAESFSISQEEFLQVAKESMPGSFEAAEFTFADYESGRNQDDHDYSSFENAEVILTGNRPLGRELLEAAGDNLKLVTVAFTGLDHIAGDYLREKNIALKNSAGYATAAVAELNIGLALALLRNFKENDRLCRDLKAKKTPGKELKSQTVGICGTGTIGCETARLFKAFGCEIKGFSRSERAEFKKYGEYIDNLDDLIKACDIVVLAMPATSETAGIIGLKELQLLEGKYLINTGRGGLLAPLLYDRKLQIEENEALQALLKLRGVALDVYDREPPLPAGHFVQKLSQERNFILLPHVGWYSEEALDERLRISLANIEEFYSAK